MEKQPLNFECVCPVGTCADEEGAEVCGSDGITYRGSCQLEMESCKQQKNITIVKERGCTYDSSWKIFYVISDTFTLLLFLQHHKIFCNPIMANFNGPPSCVD